MPERMKEIYASLFGVFADCHAQWGHLMDLYGNPKLVPKLANAGVVLFNDLQAYLVDGVLLTLARLADPATTRVRGIIEDNLSFSRIVQEVPVEEIGLITKLESRLNIYLAKAENIKTHRNKRIAHHDLTTMLQSPPGILPGLTIGDIRQAIDAAENFVQTLHEHYTGGLIDLKANHGSRGANGLMVRLAKAEAYDQLESGRRVERDFWRQFYQP
jgi:hypothetical protein